MKIFRIYIKVKKHDFCYVDYTNDFEKEVVKHKNQIHKYLTEDKLKHDLLPQDELNIFYFSIALMIKKFNLKIKDVKAQILQEKVLSQKLEETKQKHIDFWQCEKYGFNLIFSSKDPNWEKKIKENYALHDQNHINKQKWYKNPVNAYILLQKGYITDKDDWFINMWKDYFK